MFPFYSIFNGTNMSNLLDNRKNKTNIDKSHNDKNISSEVKINVLENNYDIEIGNLSDSLDSSDSYGSYDSTNLISLSNTNKIFDMYIGSGYSGFYSLEWNRPNEKSDFIVKYKGIKYIINYNSIKKIHSQTNTHIDEILRVYIHNNFDENITLCQLLV